MTSAISKLVYMPNFRAIGQSVWEKNGNRQKDRQKHRKTHLNFIKIDNYDGTSVNIRFFNLCCTHVSTAPQKLVTKLESMWLVIR